jgi:N utilization substance protein B
MLLLAGVKKEREMIDRFIASACENWKMDRIAFVDKNVMRIGVYEMLFSQDVPPKVAIDEAIEMGKKYGNGDSGDFINGVLDRILKDYYGQKEYKIK